MNNPTYRQTFAITDNLVDRYGRMKPSAMLYCIQEVSGTHAAALGVGYEILAEKNLFWAILRTRVQVTRLPRSGETVTLETWPMPTSRVAYPRAAVAYDTQGNELFRSISVWVLMDSQSRNMVLPVKSGVEVIGSVQGLELPVPTGLPAKLLPRSRSRSVCFTDLDRNGHMNNTRYMDWLWDLLPSEFHAGHELKDFTVCYLSEARENQSLQLHWDFPEADCMQVDITRENCDREDRIFAAKLLF